MACFRPIHGWRNAAGEFSSVARAGCDVEMSIPCGRCHGCRVGRARTWALRCVHEASLHEANCFVTLTYSDDHLPEHGSLNYRDFQLFMKRLRKRLRVPVRYFVCGEYGEALSRPHYHACLFGVDFAQDRKPVTLLRSRSRHTHYSSPLLEALWGLGFVDITDLNARTAEYASRYILKKVMGDPAVEHYQVVDGDGVIHSLQPEFARMSTSPGIGAEWYIKYGSDVHFGDFVVHNGSKYPVPSYYDRLRKRVDSLALQEVKAERELRAYKNRANSTEDRLAVREAVAVAKISHLKRSYES